ncbi:MAG: glycosyltransferase [Chitinophagia bacterium]|jgi:glycosyltransferase involved in cell wall biosynthesis
MSKKVIIIGPAYPLRGGLASFNQRLAEAFTQEKYDCSIYSFSLQYPSFLFPGTTQYSSDPAPENIKIHTVINSIDPINWIRIGNKIKNEKPDIILVRFWLPFMGPALGTILRRVRKNNHTKIVCLADNIIPHEKRPGDLAFTKYFISACDGFITMSEKVLMDLKQLEKNKPAKLVSHPLYDNFGKAVSKIEARQKIGIDQQAKIILFFGFIRKYKGLDLLLSAMNDKGIRESGIKLLIAGEFYEDAKQYQDQIKQLGIEEQLILRTDFIPDSEVKYYLCAADVVIQPYKSATQSGVTPLAYHFEKPMIVTNVGGLPALVPDGKVGLVVEPSPESIAAGILKFYQLGEMQFISQLRNEKVKYSWSNMVDAISAIANDIQK